MTADTVFDRVLALMQLDAEDKTELSGAFLTVLNLHLCELFCCENGLRRCQAPPREALLQPQVVQSLNDELLLDDSILAYLPYGVAGTMLAEEDAFLATQYKNKYESERAGCVRARFEGVCDAYGGDAV